MGLAYDEITEEDRKPDELDEDVKRRLMFGVTSLALFGAPVLGEILELPQRPPTPTPLPSRLTSTDVTALRGLTDALRSGARAMGGGGQAVSEIATKSMRLATVSAPDETKAEFLSALANLQTLAGFICVDSGLHDAARYHFAKSMELAHSAGDQDGLANAFLHAGFHMADAGADNDALKAFQLGLTACDWTQENADTVAMLTVSSASSLARLDQREPALRALGQSRDFSPSDPFDAALWDYIAYRVHSGLGNIDKAADFARSAVQKWKQEGKSARDSIEAEIALATLHVQTGSSDGPTMAHAAIKKVAQLSSVRARRVKLPPLVAALSERGNQTELVRLGADASVPPR
jgi:tetratricopeptide (TPR) repeat protein